MLDGFCSAGGLGGRNTDARGVALKGYDAVAYFTDNAAVRGDPQHSHQWMNATWYFASKEHQELFAKDPARYAPQYGGFCAYAVSKGAKADADPEAWDIVNGKLYLNFSKAVQGIWNRGRDHLMRKADANWPRLGG